MSSFCIAKATHIFFSKKFQHICESLDVNFNESLTNDIVSFEQLGPGKHFILYPLKHVVATHFKSLGKVLLVSTHYKCFRGEKKKNINTFGLKKASYLEL